MDDNGQTRTDINKRLHSHDYELAFIIIYDDFKEITMTQEGAFFIFEYLSQLKLHLQIGLNFRPRSTQPALMSILLGILTSFFFTSSDTYQTYLRFQRQFQR